MLKPYTGERKPRRIATYDLEWIPGDLEKARAHGFEPFQLRVIGLYDGARYRAFTDMGEFLRAIFRKETSGTWYFAHAGGLADIQFVFSYLVKNQGPYEISASFSGSSAIIVRVQRGRNHWIFCDSYWLIRAKLRDIGTWLGLEKGGEEGSTDTFYGPLSELISYNQRDCVLLYEAIRRFEEIVLELGGVLEKTAASTALKLFRSRYLTETIEVDGAVNEIARKAYVGSRVEVFSKKVEDCNYWDINSSFPYAMTFPAPGNCLGYVTKLPKSGLYLADATVKVNECDIPPLPMRTEKDRRIYFPTGRWRAWFYSTDLELLESTGHRIECVHNVLAFAPNTDLRDYAIDLYDRRKKSSDAAYRETFKIFLNALYGKFAESPFKDKIVINPGPDFFEKHQEKVDAGLGYEWLQPGVYALDEEKDIPHGHVPFSVAITSKARANLANFMLEGAPVYYCDTDGFATKAEFQSSKELGGLKLEKRIRNGYFEAPKLYMLEASWIDGKENPATIIKAKGFSRLRDPGDEENRRMTAEDFHRLVELREALYVETMSRVKSNFRAGVTDPREWLQKKRYIGDLRPKRCFHEDGSSRPWTTAELSTEYR